MNFGAYCLRENEIEKKKKVIDVLVTPAKADKVRDFKKEQNEAD